MIISAEELLKRDKLNGEERFRGMNPDILSMKLEALENLIRSYTNNNFQNRSMRIEAPVVNGLLTGYTYCLCSVYQFTDVVQKYHLYPFQLPDNLFFR